MRYNIAISGVGGLGILTLGRIISKAALLDDKLAIMSEIHGLSQRYGSVFVHVRISDGEILAPTIPQRKAHLLISLEPIEALRVAEVIGPNTNIVLNTNKIPPPTVAIGLDTYPDENNIFDALRKLSTNIYAYNALKDALELGDPRFQNTILLGIASQIPNFPLKQDLIIKAITEEFSTKKKVAEKNIEAFKIGTRIGKELIAKSDN